MIPVVHILHPFIQLKTCYKKQKGKDMFGFVFSREIVLVTCIISSFYFVLKHGLIKVIYAISSYKLCPLFEIIWHYKATLKWEDRKQLVS